MATTAVPPPQTRDLLPPLLACLPTAFVSPRPPPALLPLLSPILRQRLQYSGAVTGTDGWLSLLSWDSQRASKLASKVEGLQLEPHPVSGELEVEDVKSIEYRKLDQETLQARLHANDFDLLPVYVWCETDTQGGEAGWKLAELRALEDSEDGTEWYSSISEANEVAFSHSQHKAQTNGSATQAAQEDDDDDYWAAYDRTPARTPAKHSPAPNSNHVFSQTRDAPATRSSEEDYYARYGSVQPALDDHDPDEAPAASEAESTLTGNSLVSAQPSAPQIAPEDKPVQRSLYPSDPPKSLAHPDSGFASQHLSLQASNDISPTVAIAPRPISPASSTSSKSIERLERKVQVEADMTRAETGVKSFIGSEIRNLFRLARSVGMEREDFDEIVRRELEVRYSIAQRNPHNPNLLIHNPIPSSIPSPRHAPVTTSHPPPTTSPFPSPVPTSPSPSPQPSPFPSLIVPSALTPSPSLLATTPTPTNPGTLTGLTNSTPNSTVTMNLNPINRPISSPFSPTLSRAESPAKSPRAQRITSTIMPHTSASSTRDAEAPPWRKLA
ncbi:Hypothetical protein D9617_6g093240 [Elsinoe fawcettii]|nr:Hypothetical protein D9617_6g093240 [Elsinoe fawcettii]